MDARAVAKKYNEILATKKYMNKLYNESFSLDDSLSLLGCIMEAIISSNGEVPSHFVRTPYELTRFLYGLGLNNNDLKNNIMTNPILCHAFNGANLEKVVKYGLGSDKVIDEDIAKNINELESSFGTIKNYYHFQLNSRNEFYAGFPGFSEMEFATKYSPERLFLGILNQDKNQELPMILGETKKGYYTRVIDHKIDLLECRIDKDKLKWLGHNIVNKFCTKRPIIALFDTYSPKYNLVVRDFMKNEDVPIEKFLKINLKFYALGNPVDAFSRYTCGKNIFDVDDMSICDNVIPPTSLGLIEVPDGYELRQYLAHVKGARWGDKIDFVSGKKIDENGNLAFFSNENNKRYRDEGKIIDVLDYFKKKRLVESEFERLSKKEKFKTNLRKTSKIDFEIKDIIDLHKHNFDKICFVDDKTKVEGKGDNAKKYKNQSVVFMNGYKLIFKENDFENELEEFRQK